MILEWLPVALLAFLLGASFGSFANVVAIRLHEMSSLTGRSRCPACKKKIRARHLIPVVSWLLLGGRCADCGKTIHIQYPLVEALCGALVVIAAVRFNSFDGHLASFLFEVFLSISLVIVSVMDLRWKELPVELLLLMGGIGAAWNLGGGFVHGTALVVASSLSIGVAVAVAFFGLQWLVSRGRWMGSGDIWFGGMMGLVLGWPRTGYAIYLAYVTGGILVAGWYLCKWVKRGMQVPFAPALSLGLMLALWFQPWIDVQVRLFFGS